MTFATQAFEAATQRLIAACDHAAQVLADIDAANAEFLIPRAEFNDNDVYVYCAETRELECVIGASDPRALGYRPGPGLRAERGLWAKRRGIWRYAQTQRELADAQAEAAELWHLRNDERRNG